MELILIRHGLPLRVEREDGSPADPPLSETGRAQANAVGAWLAKEKIDAIYSSPLRRAYETAQPLSERIGMSIQLEPRVAEFDQDSETYVPLEELKLIDYERWLQFMKQGYPDGMDLESFRQGVIESLGEMASAHPGQSIAVFCHGGVINTLAADVIGLGFRLFFNPFYTSINRFLISSGGVRSVGSLNERAHLRDLEG
ncbi:MAG: histidine phosphatase family protein [Myxococcota bacterium]